MQILSLRVRFLFLRIYLGEEDVYVSPVSPGRVPVRRDSSVPNCDSKPWSKKTLRQNGGDFWMRLTILGKKRTNQSIRLRTLQQQILKPINAFKSEFIFFRFAVSTVKTQNLTVVTRWGGKIRVQKVWQWLNFTLYQVHDQNLFWKRDFFYFLKSLMLWNIYFFSFWN